MGIDMEEKTNRGLTFRHIVRLDCKLISYELTSS